MKSLNKLTAILITGTLLLVSSITYAQVKKSPGYFQKQGNFSGMHYNCGTMIPNLSDEQKEEIKELRLDHMKVMQEYKNEINEKRAQLRTLQTKDNPDMDELNKQIEEMGDIRTEMHKESAEHRQKVRSLLDDEQKIYFDKHLRRNHRGKMHNKGSMGRGYEYFDHPNNRRNRR
ncbi:MAG: Spy/CpxP family protein refolding chaperone [Bacteroidales bacterium]